MGLGELGFWEPRASPPAARFPLQDTTPDELLSAVMTAVLQDVKLSPAQLGDICVGECTTRALRSVLAFPLRRSPPQTPGTFQVFSLRGMSMDFTQLTVIVLFGL